MRKREARGGQHIRMSLMKTPNPLAMLGRIGRSG